ncbi:major facilitator superfamily transporter [Colletotrichum scovillei]|uniref:Major facilitator superfamily transporter n=1 Tax=Colletotrichum scovillei TaxID=1209932 RepID=A0A9P7QSY7_9PEZI|nr:major facilitator superfamily transporter [Colletotrichum scovillei]KAF4783968.1 major facilitator superfamily transporter [Colletotrichum scovillei]KAG7040183.1 major facilitator superfamily transporter [Colletotrichum scovillei]KAG7042365.1 major facilitator superfamily transporter [Colletotrichum scovillei]KAG7062399.1 major facilitator superfamily transporter [Colletotrichum scovillei]
MRSRAENSDEDTVVDDAGSPRSSTDSSTESTPLFATSSSTATPRKRPATGRSRTDSLLTAATQLHVPKLHNADAIVATFVTIILLGAGFGGLWTIPTTRKVEDIVCRQYYGVLYTQDAIDESKCKEDEIQSEVAMIFAVYSALQASIGAVSAFPWGIVADRLGRKQVFSLAVLGQMLDQAWFLVVCAFPKVIPLKALWVGPSMLLVGGGNAVLSAVVFSMLSDVTTSENRAKKFMAVHLASMIGNLCAPAIAGWMMERTGPWPVMWLAYAGFATLLFTIHLVPETKPPAAKVSSDPIADSPEADSPVIGTIQHTFARLKESIALLKNPSLVILMVATLSSYPVVMSTYQFMTIFASKRYHVSLSQTGYLSSLYGFGVFLTIVAILPALSKLLASAKAPKPLRYTDDHERDLFLGRLSSVALLLGALTMSASPTIGAFIGGLAILALGSGWGSYVRSLCAVYVDAAHRTRLYSIISLVETAGQTYTQPMLAGLFSLGMKLGGAWIGLPYLGVAGFCVAALGLLLMVRLPPAEGKGTHAMGDDGEDVGASAQ